MTHEHPRSFGMPPKVLNCMGEPIGTITLPRVRRAEAVFAELNDCTGINGTKGNAGEIVTDEVMAFVAEEIEAGDFPAS